MQMRAYRGSDAPAVASLLASLPMNARHRLDAGWRLATSAFQEPADNAVFVGEDGVLLGVAAWQQSWAVLDLLLRLGSTEAEVADRAVDWASARFAQLDAARGHELPYWIEVAEGDDGLRSELVARHRFDLVGDAGYVMLRRELSGERIASRIPGGFVIRPFAGAAEVPEYVVAHRAAFASRAMTVRWRSRTLAMPGYVPGLDLVAVANEGTVAGFCVVWLDRGCRAAQVEPIGVVPRFRRLGLARALLEEPHAARVRTVRAS